MPRIHIPIKVPKSFGLMTFLSIIIEEEKGSNPHHKGQHRSQLRPLQKKGFRNRYRSKNIRITWGFPPSLQESAPAGFPFPSKEIIQFSGIQL